jgi:hypothetical protein
MLRADETWADIYDQASIARSSGGKPLRAIDAMWDITETKRSHEELERRTRDLVRSNEDLRRFALAVSQDLQARFE